MDRNVLDASAGRPRIAQSLPAGAPFLNLDATINAEPTISKVTFDRWHGRAHFESVARDYGLWPRCCLIYNQGESTHGMSMADAVCVAKECDLLLDVGCVLRTPAIIGNARCRAYVDETPAKTQAFASEYGIDQGFALHDWFFTVGLNVGTARSDESRLQFAFRQALHRPAAPEEVQVLTDLQGQHFEQYQKDAKAAAAFLNIGDRPAPADIPAPELASWTSVARVILNLHETMTRD